MKQLWDSDMELMVESGFLYLPLLFDPDIEKETRVLFQPERISANSTSKSVIRFEDRYFVKAISLHSLLENCQAINAYDYERLKNDCLQEYHLRPGIDDIYIDETLEAILFQVMPYFVRKNRGLVRKKMSKAEILDFIGDKVHVPVEYYQHAKKYHDLNSLKEVLKSLEYQEYDFKTPANGMIPAHKLYEWLRERIYDKVLTGQKDRIAKTLQTRQQFRQTKVEHIAVLLYIADTGSLEIDGFGFARSNSHREYLVYKRTGEYVLKDYYARSYRFPDCRVAISTYTSLWPFVIEKYKHPFLLRHKSGQEICMKDFRPPDELNAENIIRIIEEGLTAMRYGYDGRRRNGYHSLDRKWVHIPTIDFEDYRI